MNDGQLHSAASASRRQGFIHADPVGWGDSDLETDRDFALFVVSIADSQLAGVGGILVRLGGQHFGQQRARLLVSLDWIQRGGARIGGSLAKASGGGD